MSNRSRGWLLATAFVAAVGTAVAIVWGTRGMPSVAERGRASGSAVLSPAELAVIASGLQPDPITPSIRVEVSPEPRRPEPVGAFEVPADVIDVRNPPSFSQIEFLPPAVLPEPLGPEMNRDPTRRPMPAVPLVDLGYRAAAVGAK